VRQVVNELRGEKVDVVQWRDDIGQFIAEALGPAKVQEVRIDEETKTADVIVSEHQLSLAIGKEGQNARLAARLSGYKVDIHPDKTSEPVEEEAAAAPDPESASAPEEAEAAPDPESASAPEEAEAAPDAESVVETEAAPEADSEPAAEVDDEDAGEEVSDDTDDESE
jgi:N utilization substance protein A